MKLTKFLFPDYHTKTVRGTIEKSIRKFAFTPRTILTVKKSHCDMITNFHAKSDKRDAGLSILMCAPR